MQKFYSVLTIVRFWTNIITVRNRTIFFVPYMGGKIIKIDDGYRMM